MTIGLTCGAQWCTPCPNGNQEGIICRESDRIINEAASYGQQAQAALDWWDINHPEDFLWEAPPAQEGSA